MKKFGFLDMKNRFLDSLRSLEMTKDLRSREMTKGIRLLALSLLAPVLFSCGESSGLGPEVDVVAPTVSVTSHADDDTVPSVFTLSGTAWDNNEVNLITVDFEDADLHYKIVPGGAWQKKTASLADWQEVEGEYGSCTADGQTWTWKIRVDTTEKSGSKTDNTFEFSAIASDKMGNSGKNSKVERSLTVDTENPDVTLNSPSIFTGTFSEASETAETYNLKDGNVISKLLNGELTFTGRQANSISFKELLIEFDDGALEIPADNSRTVTGDALSDRTKLSAQEVAEAVSFENDTKTKIYYPKLLKKGDDGIVDLRNWSLTVPMSEWVSDEKNPELKTGRHLIRIVTTSVSDSYAWERKVLGYFVWWPEADNPWITTYIGDDEDKGESAYEVYPSSNLSGTVQDDDGIESLSYVIKKKSEDGKFADYSSGDFNDDAAIKENAKYSAWTVRAPSENGNYSLTVTVTDTIGNSDSVTKYFKTLDVSPPKIEISSPESGSSVLSESDGTVKFRGKVTDDGTVTSFYVAFLNQNPKVNTAVQNKINFMSGNAASAAWSSGTESGFTDADGNIIYKIDLGEPEQEKTGNVYSFRQEFDLFSDLGIDGKEKTLDAIDFIFRAEDNGGTNTVEVFTLSGDTEAPVVSIDTLVLNRNGSGEKILLYNFADDTTPTLPVIKNGDTATISGTWSDNSTTLWNDYKLNILPLKLTWTDTEIAATLSEDGKWSAEVSNALLPTTSGIIKAVLTDYAGNSKTATRSVFIESAETGLESIGCNDDDGSYKEGKTIEITLEFTKATTVTYAEGNPPTLALNNKKNATYVSGSGSAKHVYTYTVSSGDDIEKLDVTAINKNDATWKDVSTGSDITVELPAENKRIGTTRNIKIDTTAPTVKSVEAITAEGDYKKDAQIFLKLTFSENVSFTNGSGGAANLSEALKLAFTHNNGGNVVTTDTTSLSGSDSVIFVYTVKDGDNAETLTVGSISVQSGLSAKDEAGNAVSSWSLPSSSLGKTIVIDTTLPAPPTVNGNWGSDSVVISEDGTSFTVAGTENGVTVEYSLDGGSNWITYKSEVSLPNNGTYSITARQTDKAGNVSENATLKTVTVDKGDLLTAITASTVSGSYSLNTNTKSVEGLIKFRAPVTIGSGATVTLNVKNNSSSYSGDKTERKVSINSAGTASNSYTFTYEIQEGDYIESNGKLDVTGWNFDSVTYLGKSVSMKFGDVAKDTKKFDYNREIYILTGKPTVQSVSLSGKGSAAVLIVTFDREITKNTGNITFTQEPTSYRVPAVLTASEYSTIPSSAKNYYTKGTNGATESGGKLTNDTSTKYILDYEKETNDTTLVGYFIAAKKHVVSVPVVSSAVVASGKTLTITLGENYALPTMGATYTLLVPQNAVSDEAQNKNAKYETDGSSKLHLTAAGIEKPEIRIKKGSQTITPGSSPSFTTGAKVSMPTTAQMKISCRTPNATIKYGISGSMSGTTATGTTETVQTVETNYNAVKNNGSPTVVTANTEYNTEITLGQEFTTYANATGAKFAISAVATKDSVTSETSYEYAARTVLKFKIDGIYGNDNAACNYNGTSAIKEGNATLTYRQLRVWVQGGDATSGGNSLDPFPLSWGESSNFKLMAGSHTDGTANMNGEWYWVTWDLSAPAYHGFVIGDVPSDAASNGPTTWYAANCGWATAKSSYPLYPGETLEMISSTISNTYQFASNLKCTRN